MPGQGAGTLKKPHWPEGTEGTSATGGTTGCHFHRPLMQMRSRVGVVSRTALSMSQIALTPAGRGASSERTDSPQRTQRTQRTALNRKSKIENLKSDIWI